MSILHVSLLVALAAGTPKAATATGPTASPRAGSMVGAEVDVWEHKCTELEWSSPADLETFANSMGLASWELVGFPRARTLCFKRKKVDPATPQGRMRILNDRLSKLTLIFNEGHLAEAEYKKRLEEIEGERLKLFSSPELF
jgi:hypothetical protein